MKEVALGNIMVDCGDEKALQAFYGQMLNWESCVLFGRPAVRSAGVSAAGSAVVRRRSVTTGTVRRCRNCRND